MLDTLTCFLVLEDPKPKTLNPKPPESFNPSVVKAQTNGLVRPKTLTSTINRSPIP